MENKEDVVVEKTAEEKLAELEAKLAEAEAQNKNLKATLSEKNSENATKKREIEEYAESASRIRTDSIHLEQRNHTLVRTERPYALRCLCR